MSKETYISVNNGSTSSGVPMFVHSEARIRGGRAVCRDVSVLHDAVSAEAVVEVDTCDVLP